MIWGKLHFLPEVNIFSPIRPTIVASDRPAFVMRVPKHPTLFVTR